MQALSELGVKSTQATLSRDIKELRLVKELSPSGRYRYAQPAQGIITLLPALLVIVVAIKSKRTTDSFSV